MPDAKAPACDGLIRVYGDSLSLPRALDGIAFSQTYPELLRREICDRNPSARVGLYNRSTGGDTIDGLYDRYLSDCSYFGAGAQLLIIQCGIVDCAPRPVPRVIRSLISRLPGPIRLPIVQLLHRVRPYLLKIGLSWRFTSPARFGRVLSRWISHAMQQGAQVFVVNIAPTVPSVAHHSPGFAESIVEYNELIGRVAGGAGSASLHLVDVHAAIEQSKDTTRYVNGTDGHHITEEGHRLYASLLLQLALPGLRQGSTGIPSTNPG